jgi:hypothetical protein
VCLSCRQVGKILPPYWQDFAIGMAKVCQKHDNGLAKRITHCFQCSDFPCTKFKRFTKRWLKYGQNFIENQKLLKNVGEVKFLKYYH